MAKNPFGDELQPKQKESPFGEEHGAGAVEEAANRAEHAARKIRALRMQLGAEGLTLSATRELIDEVTSSLDAVARALRELNSR